MKKGGKASSTQKTGPAGNEPTISSLKAWQRASRRTRKERRKERERKEANNARERRIRNEAARQNRVRKSEVLRRMKKKYNTIDNNNNNNNSGRVCRGCSRRLSRWWRGNTNSF